MIKEKVSVDDCIRLVESDIPRGKLRKYLYNLLAWEGNFETFCRFILPHAFTKGFCDFHHEIIQDFMTPDDSVVAAPRGHGKSTLIGMGYILWLILYKKERYIVYTSGNHEKSVQFLEPVKSELQYNKMLNFIYGKDRLSNVRDEDGRNREDCFDYKSIRIQALSFEKNIRGLKYGVHRPSLIILDDIDDDQRVLNPDLRKKDSDKLTKQIIPAIDSEIGKIKMVGTILHHDSLLARRLRIMDGKVYKAISEEGIILFPELFSRAKLESIKYRIGTSSFQSEYLNNPVDNSSSIIKREWVRAAYDESISFEDDTKYGVKFQGVDFAFSDRISADKSAFVGLAKVDDYYVFIQCITKKGLTITQQFDYIQMLSQEQGYKMNGLEENSIRGMSNELLKYDFPYTLFWTAAADGAKKKPSWTGDTEFKDKRHTVGKLAMIDRISTQFENRRIKIPFRTDRDKEIAHQITDELCTYSRNDGKLVETGIHGDIPIALGYALECAEKNTNSFEFVFVGDEDDEDDDEEEEDYDYDEDDEI